LRLAEELEARSGAEESYFRAQLLREDAGRVRRLAALARSAADPAAFRAAGRRLGWTQGDARTAELDAVLVPFLDAVYESECHGEDPAREERARAAWRELFRVRIERLIGCLSTPPPPPE